MPARLQGLRGEVESRATGINDTGMIVGWSRTPPNSMSDGRTYAVRWDGAGRVTALESPLLFAGRRDPYERSHRPAAAS